jgi:hypothetical protein
MFYQKSPQFRQDRPTWQDYKETANRRPQRGSLNHRTKQKEHLLTVTSNIPITRMSATLSTLNRETFTS